MAGITKFRYCSAGCFFDYCARCFGDGFFVQKYYACHLQHVFLIGAKNESERKEVVCPESYWR